MTKSEDSNKKEKPVIKSVSFKKREEYMLKFLIGIDFSYYVKSLIKKDMERQRKLKEKKEHVENLIKKDLVKQEDQELENEDYDTTDM